MRHNEPVSHIMSDHVLTVHRGQQVSDAYRLLTENQIHHLPVVNGDQLVGLISSTDIMKLSLTAYGTPDGDNVAFLDSQFSIEDVMSSDMITIAPADTIRTAAEKLSNGARHALPVVDGNANLVGIVTTTDLVKYLLDQY